MILVIRGLSCMLFNEYAAILLSSHMRLRPDIE